MLLPTDQTQPVPTNQPQRLPTNQTQRLPTNLLSTTFSGSAGQVILPRREATARRRQRRWWIGGSLVAGSAIAAAWILFAPGTPRQMSPSSEARQPSISVNTSLAKSAPAASPLTEPASVVVELETTPSGAIVSRAADDVVLGRTPFRSSLPRSGGHLAVVVRHDNFADRRVVFPLESDSHVTLMLTPLAPLTTAADPKSKAKGKGKWTKASENAGPSPPHPSRDEETEKARSWGDLVDF